MPAPSTVVTFLDDDGDDFPVRLEGHHLAVDAIAKASQIAARYIESGDFVPEGSLQFWRMERFPKVGGK